MAVAVKNAPEEAAQSVLGRLPAQALLGAAFTLASLIVVFYGLTNLWWHVLFTDEAFFTDFRVVSLLLVAMVGAAVGLTILGYRLVGTNPSHGLKAGIGLGTLGLILILFLTWCVGMLLENTFKLPRMPGIVVTLAAGAAMVYGLVRLFLRPSFTGVLEAVDDQGWFSLSAYKKSQGQRVRRGTILGVLAIAGSGIYTMLAHRTLASGSDHWMMDMPFSGDQEFILVGNAQFSIPLLLALGALWLAYRIVNWPTFADFLIATEAEMNKVSWSSKKKLIQDTIVVLVTMVILTLFLAVVDWFWIFILSRDPIPGVLKRPDTKQQSQEERPW